MRHPNSSAPAVNGDGADTPHPPHPNAALDTARETAQPIYLVPEEAAGAFLRSWGLACLYVPETLTAIEASAVLGTHAVALPGTSLLSRRWADLVAADLLDAGIIAKILPLPLAHGQTLAEWLATVTPAQLDALETLTPHFKPRRAPSNPAEWIIRFTRENADVYRWSDEVVAVFRLDDERHPVRIRGSEFEDLVRDLYWQAFEARVPKESLEAARATLFAFARRHADAREVFIRVGRHERRVYLDLGTPDHAAIVIDPSDAPGWRVTHDVPVLFYRPPDMDFLPVPTPHASQTSNAIVQRGFDAFRRFVHARSDDEVLLIWCFFVFCLSPSGPFPHLLVMASSKTGKTVTMELLRLLIDPVVKGTSRNLPSTPRELMIATRGCYLPVFDNASVVSGEMSDALCRLATGGAFAVRRLHTDDEEELFRAERPFVTTSIVDVVARPDLLSRTIRVRLRPPVRKLEPAVLREHFEAVRPDILAGMLECAWMAMIQAPLDTSEKQSRIQTFEKWADVCARLVHGPGGELRVQRAFAESQEEAMLDAVDDSPVLPLLVDFLKDQPTETWQGPMTELFERLRERLPSSGRPPAGFPGNARSLSQKLGRSESELALIGVHFETGYAGSGKRKQRVASLSLLSY